MKTRMVCRSCSAPVLGTAAKQSLEWIHLSSIAATACDLGQNFLVEAIEIRICDVRICERAADVLTKNGFRAECSSHALSRILAEEKLTRLDKIEERLGIDLSFSWDVNQRQTIEG